MVLIGCGMMAVGFEATLSWCEDEWCWCEGWSRSGGERNHCSLILLLITQDIGGTRRDGGCGLIEAICLFLGVMMVGGTEANHEGMRNHYSLVFVVICIGQRWYSARWWMWFDWSNFSVFRSDDGVGERSKSWGNEEQFLIFVDSLHRTLVLFGEMVDVD